MSDSTARKSIGDWLKRRGPGFAVGGLVGFLAQQLGLLKAVSYASVAAWGIVLLCLLGGVLWTARLRGFVGGVGVALGLLWLCVAFTPLTSWMANRVVRYDTPSAGDAIFIAAANLQPEGHFSPTALSRLTHGLDLLDEGLAPVLILTRPVGQSPSAADATVDLMEALDIRRPVVILGPVKNTRDEAKLVGEYCHEHGIGRLLVVTSPSHSLRVSRALEHEGVTVTSSPSEETGFDIAHLGWGAASGSRLQAFRRLIHEHVGYWQYRLRSWI